METNPLMPAAADAAPVIPPAPQEMGWFETVKAKLNLNEYLAKLDLSTAGLVRIGSFMGIGFLSGFLFRKYCSHFMLAVLSVVVVLGAMYHFDLITIDVVKLKDLMGIATTDTIDSVVKSSFDWVRVNMVMCVSFFVGFIIGYKIG